MTFYTILIKVSDHVPPVIKNKLLDYMVDKWWFVCKPLYKRHDLELNCFHYIWLNSSRIGVQQNIIWLQQMQLNKQSNCNKIDYVLFFTRVQLERKTIHNTHGIRSRLEFNKRYVDQLFGIRKTNAC